jgi:glucosamine 6-phosphate synthetase-like amidotransferase/phosphosugar isomerase protein
MEFLVIAALITDNTLDFDEPTYSKQEKNLQKIEQQLTEIIDDLSEIIQINKELQEKIRYLLNGEVIYIQQ